jgi:ABC-2 type transport system permease protein
MIVRPLIAVVARELTRTLRQRGRLFSALVRPLVWLTVIGGGVETLLPRGDATYRAFLAPGLLAMTLLFGAMLAALSLVHDRESGVLRLLLTAPIHHAWIVIARTVSAALVALVQASMLLAVLAVLGYVDATWNIPLLVIALVVTASAAACLGILVAVGMRTLENFSVVMNAVIFPVFFVSGALYPVSGLPAYLRWAAWANPFSYGVDLLKHAAGRPLSGTGTDFSLSTDLAVLTAFMAVATALSCVRFCQPGTAAALLRSGVRAPARAPAPTPAQAPAGPRSGAAR